MSKASEIFDTDTLAGLREVYGDTIRTTQIKEWGDANNIASVLYHAKKALPKVGRGQFSLTGGAKAAGVRKSLTSDPVVTPSEPEKTSQAPSQDVSAPSVSECISVKVPSVDPAFVPFGFFNDLKKVIGSKIFAPVYVSGDSGNGKTHMVEQLGAKLNLPVIILNVSKATTEDEMIGGFRLQDGNTIWKNGPVLDAYEMSQHIPVILLLDEIDQASIDIMCLQTILQGRPYTVKQTGVTITPNTENLNIVATGNTSGQGDSTDRFIGAEVMNEAFLERFAAEFKHEYPTPAVEKKILSKLIPNQDNFTNTLVEWARTTRETYTAGGSENFITTRRLTHIAKLFALYGDEIKSVTLSCNRFESETRDSFLNLFQALYSGDLPQTSESSTDDLVF